MSFDVVVSLGKQFSNISVKLRAQPSQTCEDFSLKNVYIVSYILLIVLIKLGGLSTWSSNSYW